MAFRSRQGSVAQQKQQKQDQLRRSQLPPRSRVRSELLNREPESTNKSLAGEWFYADGHSAKRLGRPAVRSRALVSANGNTDGSIAAGGGGSPHTHRRQEGGRESGSGGAAGDVVARELVTLGFAMDRQQLDRLVALGGGDLARLVALAKQKEEAASDPLQRALTEQLAQAATPAAARPDVTRGPLATPQATPAHTARGVGAARMGATPANAGRTTDVLLKSQLLDAFASNRSRGRLGYRGMQQSLAQLGVALSDGEARELARRFPLFGDYSCVDQPQLAEALACGQAAPLLHSAPTAAEKTERLVHERLNRQLRQQWGEMSSRTPGGTSGLLAQMQPELSLQGFQEELEKLGVPMGLHDAARLYDQLNPDSNGGETPLSAEQMARTLEQEVAFHVDADVPNHATMHPKPHMRSSHGVASHVRTQHVGTRHVASEHLPHMQSELDFEEHGTKEPTPAGSAAEQLVAQERRLEFERTPRVNQHGRLHHMDSLAHPDHSVAPLSPQKLQAPSTEPLAKAIRYLRSIPDPVEAKRARDHLRRVFKRLDANEDGLLTGHECYRLFSEVLIPGMDAEDLRALKQIAGDDMLHTGPGISLQQLGADATSAAASSSSPERALPATPMAFSPKLKPPARVSPPLPGARPAAARTFSVPSEASPAAAGGGTGAGAWFSPKKSIRDEQAATAAPPKATGLQALVCFSPTLKPPAPAVIRPFGSPGGVGQDRVNLNRVTPQSPAVHTAVRRMPLHGTARGLHPTSPQKPRSEGVSRNRHYGQSQLASSMHFLG